MIWSYFNRRRRGDADHPVTAPFPL